MYITIHMVLPNIEGIFIIYININIKIFVYDAARICYAQTLFLLGIIIIFYIINHMYRCTYNLNYILTLFTKNKKYC